MPKKRLQKVGARKRLQKVGYHPRAKRKDAEWTFQAAAAALDFRSYIHLDWLPLCDDDGNDCSYQIVPDTGSVTYNQPPRPDKYTEQVMAHDGLSEEALYVLDLVLNTPREVLGLIATPIQEQITKRRLEGYLRRAVGWKPEVVRKVFGEIANYTEALG